MSVHAVICVFNLKEHDAFAGSVTAVFNTHGFYDGFIFYYHALPLCHEPALQRWPAFCTLLCSAVQFGSSMSFTNLEMDTKDEHLTSSDTKHELLVKMAALSLHVSVLEMKKEILVALTVTLSPQ